MSISTDYKNLLSQKDDISSELITDHGTGPSVQEQLTEMMAMFQKQKKDMDELKDKNKKLETKLNTLEKKQEEMKKDISDLVEKLQKSNIRVEELEETLNNVLTEHKEQIKEIMDKHEKELEEKSRENEDLKKALAKMKETVNTDRKKVGWSWSGLLAGGVGGLAGVGAYAIGTMCAGTRLVVSTAAIAGLLGAFTLIMAYIAFS